VLKEAWIVASLTIGSLVLSACVGPTTRQCGVFNHPLADIWLPYEESDTLTFAGLNAGGVSYSVASSVLNEPFENSSRGAENASEVRCILSATYQIESLDGVHVLEIELTQIDFPAVELAEQPLDLTIDLMPDGSENRIDFGGFRLPTPSNDTDFSDDQFTAMSEDRIEILGETFENVLIGTASPEYLDTVYEAGQLYCSDNRSSDITEHPDAKGVISLHPVAHQET